jgi:hypothetical protein
LRAATPGPSEIAADAIGTGEVVADDLDGDVPIQLRVARPIDFAHPAGAQQRDVSYDPIRVPGARDMNRADYRTSVRTSDFVLRSCRFSTAAVPSSSLQTLLTRAAKALERGRGADAAQLLAPALRRRSFGLVFS